jgi:hypothetical protein
LQETYPVPHFRLSFLDNHMIDLAISEILLPLQSQLLDCSMIWLSGGTILSHMVGQTTLKTGIESLTSLSCSALLVLGCRTRELLKILPGLQLQVGMNHLCRGLVPRVLWVVGTAQKSGYEWFPLATNDRGTMHPIPDMALTLLGEEEGPQPKKN